jgi:hypothetical protein
MNKEKTLFLIEANPNVDIFFNDWIEKGYKAEVLFKKKNKILRAVRRCWLRHNFAFPEIWYNRWFKELDNFETIIIHMSRLTSFMPFIIRKKYPHIRVICWYWNTINEETIPIKTTDEKVEYWTFDDNDCQKYQMHKNIQYYCQPKYLNKKETKTDIYFIGRPKGRTEKIYQIKEFAENNNLVCDFNIVDSNEVIPYSRVKDKLLETKAILEINKKDQVGLTLRAMESLFYEIKLITDNKNIKNEVFYIRDNIFILDEDKNEDLPDFISRPYNHHSDIYKKDYNLDRWFKNFDKNY